MRNPGRTRLEKAEYNAWFRAEIEAAIKEADDPNTRWFTQEEAQADMERQRQSLLERIAARDAALKPR